MRVTIQTVSRLTGLSADALRMWERRYGVVTPERSPRGVRMYAERDILRLQLLANGVRRGERISSLAQMSDERLRTLFGANGTRRSALLDPTGSAAQTDRSAASDELLTSLHDAAVRTIARGLGTQCAAIFEIDESFSALKLCAQFGYPHDVSGLRVPLSSNTFPAFAASRNQPVLMTDRSKEKRFELIDGLDALPIQSAIAVPYGEQNHLAVVTAHSFSKRMFTLEDISFVKSIAGILTVATERAGAERELQRANEAMSELMGAVGDGFIVLDDEWFVTYANQAFLSRSPQKDVIGKRAQEILPHLQDPIYFNALSDALKQSKSKRYEFYSALLHCWFEAVAQPVSGGLAINFRDVSLRKITEYALEGRSAFAKMLLRSVPGAFWTTDSELIVRSASGKLLRLLGIPKNGIVGKHINDVFGNLEYGAVTVGHERARTGLPTQMEVRHPLHRLQIYVEALRDSSTVPVGTIAFAIATG